MTELARAIQDWFNPHWTETRPTVRESSPEDEREDRLPSGPNEEEADDA